MTILLGLAAVNTGNNLIFILVSAMLGFMSITGIVGWLNLRSFHIILSLPDEIYATLPTLLTIRVASRRSLLPTFLLKIETEGASTFLPYLGPKKTAVLKVPLSFSKRGPGSIDHVWVSSPFPVNFFVRSTMIDICTDLLIFPRPLPLPLESAPGRGEKRGDGALLSRGGGEYAGTVTRYTGHEPLKLVHWRLSARHGELKVKEMKGEAGTPVIIDPNELPGSLETRLSHAVYLINRLMASGNPVGLKLGDDAMAAGISDHHRLGMLGKLSRHAA